MTYEKQISAIINDSLNTEKSLFILSNPATQCTARQKLVAARKTGSQPKQGAVGGVYSSQYIAFPWPERPAHALYCHLMEIMQLDELIDVVQGASSQGDFSTLTSNALLIDVLNRLDNLPRYFPGGKILDEATQLSLLSAYLYDTCSSSELRRLFLPRNLTTQDRFQLLPSIWRCLQGLEPDDKLDRHTRIWIWLTGVENLLQYTAKDCWEVTQGVAYLVEHSKSYLTFWLSCETEHSDILHRSKEALGEKVLSLIDHDLTL